MFDESESGGTMTPEERRAQGAAHTEWWANPDNKAKVSATHKKRWADPAHKEKMKAIRSTPDYRKKQSAAQKAEWQKNPAGRTKRIAAVKATKNTSAYKEKVSGANGSNYKGYVSDPLAVRFGDRKGVYVVHSAGIDKVKIGSTMDADQRIQTLQRGCPVPLQYAALCECAVAGQDRWGMETAMHRHFKSRHSLGEWFNVPVHEAVSLLVLIAEDNGLHHVVDGDFFLL